MRCPYCISEIDDLALACPHCARDLYLFKPLLEKITQLEKAVAAGAETRIAVLEAEVAVLKQAAAEAVPVQLAAESGEVEGFRPDYALALLKTLLPAFALLVAAHGVLLFVFDAEFRDMTLEEVTCEDLEKTREQLVSVIARESGKTIMGIDWTGRGSEPAHRPMEAFKYRSNGAGKASASPS